MTGWTDQPDDVGRCSIGLGPVNDNEDIARLLHSGIDSEEPRKKALRTDELFWTGGQPISNECGYSSGPSVDRCTSLSDDEIRSRAVALAGEKRQGRGAIIANAGELRAIRTAPQADKCVFIYEDPRTENLEHAVMRGRSALVPAEQRFVRDEILRRFNRRIPPS